ncbi:MAG: toll/interleukin-1 receptor domain-containing protein, partial [Solirubrobacterales bacterium]
MATDGTDRRIFLSFAVPDAGLANALVNFLRLGCDLSEGQIFVTARPGALPIGIQFVDAIRETLDDAAMAVLLLTPSYYESRFCLAEAGAVWVQQKVHVPLVVPPIDYHDLEGVQLGEQALKINSSSALDQLRDLISEVI